MRFRWTVLVPIRGVLGKSRLPQGVGGHPRSDWVVAMAHDTVTAVARAGLVERVVVVLGEPFDELASRLGALSSVELTVQASGEDLNSSLTTVASRFEGRPVAVVLGDLPCLRPADLDEVLLAAAAGPVVVADADRAGSVMIADPASPPAPRFGQGSLAAHLGGGYRELTAPLRLRRDVDTEVDLRSAIGLGLGEATAALASGWPGARAQ